MVAVLTNTYNGNIFEFIPREANYDSGKVGTGGTVVAGGPIIPDGLVEGSYANAGDAGFFQRRRTLRRSCRRRLARRADGG